MTPQSSAGRVVATVDRSWLLQQISDTAAYVAGAGNTWRERLGDPAPLEAIDRLSAHYGEPLPRSLLAFYGASNGADFALWYYDPRFACQQSQVLSIPSIEASIEYSRVLCECTGASFGSHSMRYIPCAILQGSGDYCVIDRGRNVTAADFPVVVADHEHFESWAANRPIADSFAEWLAEVLRGVRKEHGDLTYWNPQEDEG